MDDEKHMMIREWQKLEQVEAQLQEEKRQVSQAWLGIERKHVAHQAKRDAFEATIASAVTFLPAESTVTFNIGGQLFSDSVRTWTRDRFSTLAHMCLAPQDSSEEDQGEPRIVYLDRDWYIFRYIFLFLRDKTLPEEVETLRELYYEASYYRIALLRHAIEARLVEQQPGPEHSPIVFPSSTSNIDVRTSPGPKKKPAPSKSRKVKETPSVWKAEPTETETPATSLSLPVDQCLPDPHGFISPRKVNTPYFS